MQESVVPKEVKECIENNNKFIIMAHKQPDADTLCSALALDSFLTRKGKTTSLYTAGPFTRIETLHLEKSFNVSSIKDEDKKDSIVIIVDCSSPDRVGFLEDEIADMEVLIIDHHVSDGSYGNYLWIEPSYPATTLMIQDLILEDGYIPTPFEAETLFLGFCTDTGFFKHLDKGSNKDIEKAASLVKFGASPKGTFSIMTGGKTLSSRQLLGRILERSRAYYDGKVIISWEDLKDREELKAEDRDSDTLYQALLSIEGVEAIAVIRQESEDKCTVGLRSVKDVNVSKLAETFGGGGHKRASGFATKGKRPDVMKAVIDRFKEYL